MKSQREETTNSHGHTSETLVCLGEKLLANGTILQVAQGDRMTLAEGESREVLQSQISYYAHDLAVIGWNAAFVYDSTAGAETAVELLEYANSQLLEFRHYDELLSGVLDDALGADFDAPKVQRSTMDRSASFAAGAGAKAMKDLTEGWIPMRNWVRYMTGAEQHSKDVQGAIYAGQARRAYLKGLAQSEGCVDLGPAQPVYQFPAPPRTPSSVAQN